MKNLIWTLFLFVVSPATAEVSFLPVGELGQPSHIDAVNFNSTVISYRTNSPEDNIDWTYGCPSPGPNGTPPNHFQITRNVTENGQVRTRVESRHIAAGSTCEQIRQQDPTISDCSGTTVLTLNFREKNPALAQGPMRTVTRTIDLSSPDIQDKLKRCTGGTNMIALVDPNGRGILADFNKKIQCDPPKQRLSLPGASWDDNSFPNSHIRTSNGGIMIGNHTHAYFDERRKLFCIHFRPDIGNANTVCKREFTGMTFPIEFVNPSQRVVRGAFRLAMDSTGKKPVIEVGASNNPNPPLGQRATHRINYARPFIRATIDLDHKAGKSITYTSHTGGTVAAPAVRTLHMSPQYRLGTQLENQCDPAMCVNRPGDNTAASCSKRDPVFNLAANPTSLCYSCNGVSPGVCGEEKRMLTSPPASGQNGQPLSAAQMAQYHLPRVNSRMLACTGTSSEATPVPPQSSSPTVDQ
ncbi:MAG: hypothetical protein K2Q26_02915 [Bdellovibrionales bacterium]|nr:hypothetical protein [Bdellovibrionales bacterium]